MLQQVREREGIEGWVEQNQLKTRLFKSGKRLFRI